MRDYTVCAHGFSVNYCLECRAPAVPVGVQVCSSEPHPPHASQVPGFAGCPGTPPVGVQPEPAEEPCVCSSYPTSPAHCIECWEGFPPRPAVPVVHPEPGDRLRDAMREAGAAIEDMKPGTRFDAVRAAWTSLGLDDAGKAQAFVIGVMIHAHDMRTWDRETEAAAAVAAVRADLAAKLEALHYADVSEETGEPFCGLCDDTQDWPCETLRIVRGVS